MNCVPAFLEAAWNGAWSSVVFIEHWLDTHISSGGLIAIPAIIAALLMPIAIFLMERQDQYEFDKSVIVDKILLAKLLVPFVILVSLALLYHSSLSSIILSIVLLVITTIALIRTYRWTKSYEATRSKITYRQQKRLDYLNGLKSDNDKLEVWSLIFSDDDFAEKNQKGLIELYIKMADKLEDKDGAYHKLNMHMLLLNNLDKVNLADYDTYEQLLAYSLRYFDQKQTLVERRRKNKKSDAKSLKLERPDYHLEDLFERLMKISIGNESGRHTTEHLFFHEIDKYTKRQSTSVPIFAEELFGKYIDLLDENDKVDVDLLWHYMSSWTVTRKSLEDKSTQELSRHLLQAYNDTIINRAHTDAKLFSREAKIIDGVTEHLLPKLNPIIWFNVITFYVNGWGSNEGEDSLHAQIRNHIERGRNFGLVTTSGLMGWNGDETESPEQRQAAIWKEQDDEAMYMLGLIFPWLRNPDEIQKVIDKATEMLEEKSITKDEKHKMRLQTLRNQFQSILDFVHAEIAKQDGKKEKKK